MILAGDVGASNTRLGLFDTKDGSLVPVSVHKFRNRDFPGLEAVLDEFVPADKTVDSACCGVAGPVFNNKSTITNCGWEVDASQLQQRLRGAAISLINDMEATAYGIPQLRAEDLLVLNAGRHDANAPAALIAAGTGLGETILQRNGTGRIPIPAEAGHADFAPNNDLESDLLLFLRKQLGHVSWDRVLSGPGLLRIYEFFRDSGRGKANPTVAERIRNCDPGAAISEAAIQKECDVCVKSLDLFTGIYGAESGNLALRALARAGVYVGGGIAPKIRQKLAEGTFMRSFVAKGRMQPLVETFPVYVILNDQAALLGAASYAARNG